MERDRRENTVLRGQLFEPSEEDPSVSVVRSSVYTIPNALVAEQFTPSPQPQPLETSESIFRSLSISANEENASIVNIVVISRLAYRKGIDLLVATAPRICAAFPNVNFIVGESQRGSIFTQFHGFQTRWRRPQTKRPAPSARTSPPSRPRRITRSCSTPGRARCESPLIPNPITTSRL